MKKKRADKTNTWLIGSNMTKERSDPRYTLRLELDVRPNRKLKKKEKGIKVKMSNG